jgi:hypothetical protein
MPNFNYTAPMPASPSAAHRGYARRLAGDVETVSNNSAIVGGEDNLLAGGDQRHSFIGGGHGNVISGRCSAILGGQGNNVTHNFAAAFGNGINSVANDMFHVSCLNAVNSPALAGQPPGTLTFINVTAAMVGVGFPAGARIAMIA